MFFAILPNEPHATTIGVPTLAVAMPAHSRHTILGIALLLVACVGPKAETESTEVTINGSQQSAPALESYEQAMAYARSLNCVSSDMSRSSWIRRAEYCRSHEEDGFLLVDLKGRWYIHEGVPNSVWIAFDAAPSPGRFYNTNLRSRYRLVLR